MIFTIKIKLVRGICVSDSWECNIEIPSDFDLIDVHEYLQTLLNFDDDHMFEFYIASSERGKKTAVFECDDKLIEKTSISEFITRAKGKKAFYLFDYGDNWLFQISNSRKKPFSPASDVEYPRVLSEAGTKPEQYPDWDD